MKFEEKMNKLETIINDLESDNSDLNESINKYTLAMKLIKECDSELKDVEEKINKIVNKDGVLEDFEIEE